MTIKITSPVKWLEQIFGLDYTAKLQNAISHLINTTPHNWHGLTNGYKFMGNGSQAYFFASIEFKNCPIKRIDVPTKGKGTRIDTLTKILYFESLDEAIQFINNQYEY